MKSLYIVTFLAITNLLYSQVGINTANPQAIFHVDGSKDNNATGAPTVAQQANDAVVTSTGNVGLGITNPSTKLDINNGTTNGAIKITDGTQGEGKVLTSNAVGVGTWRSSSVSNVTGITPTVSTPYGTTADKYMNSSITLPPGKWFIFLGYLVNGATAANTTYGSRFTLSSSTTAIQNVGFTYLNGNSLVLTQVSNGNTAHSAYGMFCSGIIRVDVTSNVTLYVWDTNSRGFGSAASLTLQDNGENYLFAISAN